MLEYELYADGSQWEDADGRTQWSGPEADALADMLAGMGYDVEFNAVTFFTAGEYA